MLYSNPTRSLCLWSKGVLTLVSPREILRIRRQPARKLAQQQATADSAQATEGGAREARGHGRSAAAVHEREQRGEQAACVGR